MEEVWKDIEGYEGLYQISNLGNIKSLKYNKTETEKKIKLYNKRNYLQVALAQQGKIKWYSVHRLVAKAFIPNPNNYPCINHKDENKQNNCIDNLEWCTHKYNSNYGTIKERQSNIKKGRNTSQETRNKIGEANSKQVGQFKKGTEELIQVFPSVINAAKQLGLKKQNISACCLNRLKSHGGYSWKYI